MPPSEPRIIEPGVSLPGSRVRVAVWLPAGISPIAPLVEATKPPPGTYSVNHRSPLRSNAIEVTSIEPDPLIGIRVILPALLTSVIPVPPSANQAVPLGPAAIGTG